MAFSVVDGACLWQGGVDQFYKAIITGLRALGLIHCSYSLTKAIASSS